MPPVPYQMPDLVQVFQAAMNLRAQQQQLEHNKFVREQAMAEQQQKRDEYRDKQELRLKVGQLAQAAAGGDDSAMQQLTGLDPELAQKISGLASNKAKTYAMQEERLAKELSVGLPEVVKGGNVDTQQLVGLATKLRGLAGEGLISQDAYEQLAQKVGPVLQMSQKLDSLGGVNSPVTDAARQQVLGGINNLHQMAQQTLQVYADPSTREKYTTAQRNVAARVAAHAMGMAKSPEEQDMAEKMGADFGLALRHFPKMVGEEMAKEMKAKGTTVNVNTGAQSALTSANVTKVQGEQMTQEEAIATIDNLLSIATPERFDYMKRGEAWWAGIKENARLGSAEDAELITKQQDFDTSRGEYLSQAIKALSGAAVSNEERAYLEGFKTPNNYSGFVAAMKRLRQIAENAKARSERRLGPQGLGIKKPGASAEPPKPPSSDDIYQGGF